jgi:hypothetical protein
MNIHRVRSHSALERGVPKFGFRILNKQFPTDTTTGPITQLRRHARDSGAVILPRKATHLVSTIIHGWTPFVFVPESRLPR